MQEFNRLIEIVKKLRSPDGCPWDREQTLYSMKASMMEEASELLDALDNKDIENIAEELGDLLLHVVMHAQIAEESGLFTLEDAIRGINEKLIRRHPHVFAGAEAKTTAAVLKNWEEIKKQEKRGKPEPKSVLDKLPASMPTLMKAEKLQKKAASYGFDWDDTNAVFAKLEEEISELKEAALSGDKEKISGELGDVIFVTANLARHLGVDADESLRKTNKKFRDRFYYIENALAEKRARLEDAQVEKMEELWREAKQKE